MNAIIVMLLLSVPDQAPRSRALRVVDTYLFDHECEFACDPGDPDPSRDTACIQEAIDLGSAIGAYNATELPPGACLVNATLVVPPSMGYSLYGHGPYRTDLIWTSEAAADPMLLIDDVYVGRFYDFSLDSTASTVSTAVELIN
ncbi:MAG: hypothetical protein JNJ59_07330, partial [Deltaproteobacteria bacterium]|nr:hypothetical protein [Deltaproteobacteria bacterium]